MGTLYETGREIGHVVLKGFSTAVVIGVKECAELWEQKVRGDLPDEDDDNIDVADDNDADNAENEKEKKNGSSDLQARIDDDENATMSSENNDATRRRIMPLKTKPSWKAGDSNHLIVGNMRGCRKKITQMDSAILKLLSVPRTMTESTLEDHNSEETVTLVLEDSSTTVTKEMFLVLIRYYYSVLRFFFLGDSSQMPQFFESDFFQLTSIRANVEQFQKKGATSTEERIFAKIEWILALKAPPSKKQILDGFKDLRLMLTPQIDDIITTVARTALEESEKCVNLGTIETCWSPWAERLQKSSTYMTHMEEGTFIDEDMHKVNMSLKILSDCYSRHVQKKSSDEVESLIYKLKDSHIDRIKTI